MSGADVLPFILCGGAGTRLWPLSREAFPKQFHRLTGPQSLFQETCARLSGGDFGKLSVLSNHQHRFLIQEQLQELGSSDVNVVLEPASRNTAPAACVAALIGGRADRDALVLLAPSDHAIGDNLSFAESVCLGAGAARDGAVVTFGVEPDCAHTGYGYIETNGSGANAAASVTRFVEKPSREAAERYLETGGFYWNAGIFLFRAATMIKLFDTHAPEILFACRAALNEATTDLGFKNSATAISVRRQYLSTTPSWRRQATSYVFRCQRLGATSARGLSCGATSRRMTKGMLRGAKGKSYSRTPKETTPTATTPPSPSLAWRI